jgi:hypothetical protein
VRRGHRLQLALPPHVRDALAADAEHRGSLFAGDDLRRQKRILGHGDGYPGNQPGASAGIKIAYAGLTDAASIQVSTAKSSSGT